MFLKRAFNCNVNAYVCGTTPLNNELQLSQICALIAIHNFRNSYWFNVIAR